MLLSEKLKGKTQVEANQYVKGKKFKVISNASGSGVPVGEHITMTSCNIATNTNFGGSTIGAKRISNNIHTGWCGLAELECPSSTLKDLEDDIESIDNTIIELKQSKKLKEENVQFMKKNGLKEFNEDEFKVFAVLETLEQPGLSKIKRAQLITKLIKES